MNGMKATCRKPGNAGRNGEKETRGYPRAQALMDRIRETERNAERLRREGMAELENILRQAS